MAFDETKHARGTGAKGGQFVASGSSGENDTVGYDAKKGTGAGYGAKGGDKRVKELQTLLNKLGMKDAAGNPLKVDGKLGPRTTAAIKRMQRRLGLPADGKVSPALLGKIRAATKPGAKKTAAPAKKTTAAPAKKTAAPAKKAAPARRPTKTDTASAKKTTAAPAKKAAAKPAGKSCTCSKGGK